MFQLLSKADCAHNVTLPHHTISVSVYSRAMGLRLAPRWLKQADERILEYAFYEDEELIMPKDLESDPRVDFSAGYLRRRFRLLSKAGFLERRRQGVYRITEDGIALLRGDDDFTDREEPT